MNTHIVTRKFNGPESVQLMPGTKVDTSNWPNLNALVDTNYLRPLNANEIAEVSKGADSSSKPLINKSPR